MNKQKSIVENYSAYIKLVVANVCDPFELVNDTDILTDPDERR